MNSWITWSIWGKYNLTLWGRLKPCWNSLRSRHHSGPFLIHKNHAKSKQSAYKQHFGIKFLFLCFIQTVESLTLNLVNNYIQAFNIPIIVYWVMTPCSLASGYTHTKVYVITTCNTTTKNHKCHKFWNVLTPVGVREYIDNKKYTWAAMELVVCTFYH